MRHLCLACADLEQSQHTSHDHVLNHGAILIAVGAVVFLLSALADWLRFGHTEGFGPKQEVGLGLAAVCIFTAAVLRIPTLLVIAILAGGLTILADVLRFGQEAGFGWQQMLGVMVGITLIASGLLEMRRHE